MGQAERAGNRGKLKHRPSGERRMNGMNFDPCREKDKRLGHARECGSRRGNEYCWREMESRVNCMYAAG